MKKNNLNYSGRNARLSLGAALAALASLAAPHMFAVTVDGIFTPSDGYTNSTDLVFTLDNGTLVKEPGKLYWTQDATTGNVFVAFVQPLTLNDNTYGANAIGWNEGGTTGGGKKGGGGGGGGGGHSFGNLTGSDKAHFDFTNGAGQSVFSFDVDYISASSGAPSGFESLGLGGDGGLSGSGGGGKKGGGGGTGTGNGANLLQWGSSLDYNFNQLGFVLTEDSPAAHAQRDANGKIDYSKPYILDTDARGSFAGWEFAIQYEIEVSAAAFGSSGFGSVTVPFAHDSPSKVGQNTVMVIPEPSTYLAGLIAIAVLVGSHFRFAARRKATA